METAIPKSNHATMFQLNLKLALRSLWKNKSSSLINIIGLGVGLAGCLLLLIYVNYEWSFDRQSKNAANVYVAMTNVGDENGNITATFNGTSTGLAELLKTSIPDIQYITRMNYGSEKLIANGINTFKQMAKFAEPDIFRMYDYTFIAGSPNNALLQPNSVVLTETTAKLLFGTTDVLGRPVKIEGSYDLSVTGIIKDLPKNSSNRFDFLMPWSIYGSFNPSAKGVHWDNYSFITLVRLKENADTQAINKKISSLVNATLKKNTGFPAHFLYPLSRLHLFGSFEKGKNTGGEIQQIRLLLGLAIGILLIACINFMNLAIAKSEKRTKEVGIKKTIGATKLSLISQFLLESIVLSFVSFILSVTIAELALPWFNNLLDISATLNYSSIWIWPTLLGIIILTGIIAGSYPAFYLSSFNPIQALKKRNTIKKSIPISFRQLLVIGQFSFAALLIVATLVIYNQIRYISGRPIGIAVDALAEMPQDGNLIQKFDVFKTQLLKSGVASSVSQSSERLAHQSGFIKGVEWVDMRPSDKEILFNKVTTTYDYIQTTGTKLIAGRDFSPLHPTDTAGLLISSAAAKVMNLKDPIGKTITQAGTRRTIIGVFQDYVWDSPYRSSVPMIIGYDPGATGTIVIRLTSTQSLSNSTATITDIAKSLNPMYPANLKLTSASYTEMMQKEKRLGTLSNVFGGLSVFISCMGLYALVAFSAQQRTKEFGIRKVLGANNVTLVTLLSVSFIKLILIALLIAIPLSCYLMQKWMGNFEYQAGISWWIITLTVIGTLFIAMITISLQAYKSATANPLQALKHE